jgi:uncharacterized membrane protein YdjX (TVP38/TMEM64 family)
MNEDYEKIWDDPELLKEKRKIAIFSLALVLLIVIVLTFVIGKPLVQALRDEASFQEFMQSQGFFKYPLMAGIMTLQVLIAFIPGEPIEIAAGYIFGAWMGMTLCLIGSAVGGLVIFLLVRRYGIRFVSLFVTKDKMENLRFFKDPKKRDITIFLLFLIPGTPKDVLTYLVALTPVPLGKYLFLTTIARIPSVLSSTLGGSMIGQEQYRLAIIVFGITMILSLGGYLIYQNIQNRKPEKTIQQPESDKTENLCEKEAEAQDAVEEPPNRTSDREKEISDVQS